MRLLSARARMRSSDARGQGDDHSAALAENQTAILQTYTPPNFEWVAQSSVQSLLYGSISAAGWMAFPNSPEIARIVTR